MEIRDQVVLITGASEGIGAACAAAFRDAGARVILTARREDKLRQVARGDELLIPGDITDAAVRRRVVDEALASHGRIDILLNNAGRGMYAPSHTADMSTVRQMFELNVFAPLELTQLVVPQMKQRRHGLIVNIGSIGGKVTLPWFTMYSATKYAIGSMTEGLRMELHQHGIRTMVVCPGYVQTRFQQNVLSGQVPEKVRQARKFAITPEECAADIVAGVQAGKRTVVTPKSGWGLVAAARLLPGAIEWQFRRYLRSLGDA